MFRVIFDVQTMLFMNVLIGLCISASLCFSLRDRFTCPGAHYWCASMICSTIGLMFLWLRLYTPLWLSVVLGNGFIVLSYSLLWLGFRQYTKSITQQDRLLMILAPLIAVILFIFLQLDENNLVIRAMLVSYALTGLIAMSIYQALKGRKPSESGRLFCVLALVLTLLCTLVRALTVQKSAGYVGLLDTNMSNVFLMATSGISLLSVGFGVMLISSQWLQQRLYIHATYDALTGVYNRYALIELGDTLELTTDLSIRKWSLAMIDLDHFKLVNDRYGHPVGDQVLQRIATTLKESIRHCDILARYGGEEFVVVLPDCDKNNARIWAERIRKNIEETTMLINDQPLQITVSIGIATSTPTACKLNDVLPMADSALYEAKKAGRNQVHEAILPCV